MRCLFTMREVLDKIPQLLIGSSCANLERMKAKCCVVVRRENVWFYGSAKDRSILGIRRRGQGYFDARVVLIDVFIQVRFNDAVVVNPESLTEGILCNLESTIDVSPQG